MKTDPPKIRAWRPKQPVGLLFPTQEAAEAATRGAK